jgi:thermitase
MGEKLKNKLNHHPKIIKIHHNSRDKSHYFNHEITVRFQTLPSPREIKQMEQTIDGKLVNRFDRFFIFRSSTKAYNELCQYFQSIPSVAYLLRAELYLLQNEVPNDLLYSRYQWNLPAIDTEAERQRSVLWIWFNQCISRT